MNLILDSGGVLIYPRLGDWHSTFLLNELISDPGVFASDEFAYAHESAARFIDESQYVPDEKTEFPLRCAYFRELSRLMHWGFSEETVMAIAADFMLSGERHVYYGDVFEYLPRFAEKCTLALLSDAMPSMLMRMSEAGSLKYFREFEISTFAKAIKPARIMYENIMARLGAKACECVFVDDRVCNVNAARELGMSGVLMRREVYLQTPLDPPEACDAPVVESLAELYSLLEL